MDLYSILSKEITDPRRLQGQRINKMQLTSLIILSGLCGHFGGRGVARFIKIHEKELRRYLGIKHNLPSHVTISDYLNRLDNEELKAGFNKWALQFREEKEAVSMDGKSLKSTLKSYVSKSQNFESIVSVFSHEKGLVYAIEEYSNKKKSEIGVVRVLLQYLEKHSMTVYLDALHCQKKR